MIIYFTGRTFNQVIQKCIEDIGELVFEPQVEENQDFLKFIKQKIAGLSAIDYLVLDTSVCLNTDDEILSALEMLRTMYDEIRIIIFAPYRPTGDKFLASCLQMGITNIINTDDFNELNDQLLFCITKGMTYRDAVKYKKTAPEKVIVKHVKKAVNKRMIGIAGAQSNIGVTHSIIILANFFRKKGFMVAVVEMNDSQAFNAICSDFDEKKFEEGYFSMNGIDFYPAEQSEEDERMQLIQSHSYNVILFDFGVYGTHNREAFERCEDRIVIAGSKSWELDELNYVFANASKDILLKYVFVFNFTMEKEYALIRKGMEELENVHFLKYEPDPYNANEFPDGDEIFESILPDEPEEEEKKGFMKKLLNREKPKRSNKDGKNISNS